MSRFGQFDDLAKSNVSMIFVAPSQKFVSQLTEMTMLLLMLAFTDGLCSAHAHVLLNAATPLLCTLTHYYIHMYPYHYRAHRSWDVCVSSNFMHLVMIHHAHMRLTAKIDVMLTIVMCCAQGHH